LFQTSLIAPSLVLVPAKRTYSLNHRYNDALFRASCPSPYGPALLFKFAPGEFVGREPVLPEPARRDHRDSLVQYAG
jgi:hypothetical protein